MNNREKAETAVYLNLGLSEYGIHKVSDDEYFYDFNKSSSIETDEVKEMIKKGINEDEFKYYEDEGVRFDVFHFINTIVLGLNIDIQYSVEKILDLNTDLLVDGNEYSIIKINDDTKLNMILQSGKENIVFTYKGFLSSDDSIEYFTEAIARIAYKNNKRCTFTYKYAMNKEHTISLLTQLLELENKYGVKIRG